jgi:hypothetical protein
MRCAVPRWFYDKDDYELLEIVNDILVRRARPKSIGALMAPSMHPHGIKQMAASSGLRIAHAVAGLLDSLDIGKSADRLLALRALRDEVLGSNAGYAQKNTARVLVQIMKELIRCHGDELCQLRLAHDFRSACDGKPRRIRAELAKYHLLEMPEEWNQFAFDDHVHDANTKGRKSPTHLIMDAWLKGIRRLTVVYYNVVEEEVIEELLEASALLDIHVRIGIELSSRLRNGFVRFIWELEGFLEQQDILKFFREEMVRELMNEGREVSRYQQQYVAAVLKAFNDRHRQVLAKELDLMVEEIHEEEFLAFVGTGQPSLLHLAKYIHNSCRRGIDEEVRRLCDAHIAEGSERQQKLDTCLAKMNELEPETLINRFLHPRNNPDLHDPSVPRDSGMPKLLELSIDSLIDRLVAMHPGSRFTLNLSQITVQDTLELLYLCKGRITHIESFNLKDSVWGMTSRASSRGDNMVGEAVDITSPTRTYRLMNELQTALNEGNVIALKSAIRTIIYEFERSRMLLEQSCEQKRHEGNDADLTETCNELKAMNEQKEVLLALLQDMASLHGYYVGRSLGTRIGSGSTGQSQRQYGMGFVVVDTLPLRVQRSVMRAVREGQRKRIPVTAHMIEHLHYAQSRAPSPLCGILAKLPGLRHTGARSWRDWSLERFELHPEKEGNIVTLGGMRWDVWNELRLPQSDRSSTWFSRPYSCLNTNVLNALKILTGFIPAFLTFSLTKDWWVLAYLGAFIWFGITGVRNIIQSVLGGGGLQRSPLLPWKVLVNWSRVADSLLYTGFSVPLLDYVVKTLLLQQCWGITTATSPILLYAFMGLANGLYISGHNIVRGLPRSAVIGNFFRSILSIPLAVLFNAAIGWALHMAMVPGVDLVLQKWAAVISKLASDCVAGVIEGLADRAKNVRVRLADYQGKIARLFASYARLDLLFPDEDVLDLLLSPKKMMASLRHEARDLEKVFIVNALDLMYMWMYQPRAQKALEIIVAEMSLEQWHIFHRSQLILKRQKEISKVFIDGLVGKNFSRALAFYLERKEQYLQELDRMGRWRTKRGP